MLVACSQIFCLPRATSRLFAASLNKNEKKSRYVECDVLSSASTSSSRLLTTSAAFSRGEGGYSRREAKRKHKGRLEYLNRPDPCEDEGLARVEDDLHEWQVGEGLVRFHNPLALRKSSELRNLTSECQANSMSTG